MTPETAPYFYLPPVHVMTHEELRQDLLALEEEYGMKSEDFYSRRQAGETLAPFDALRWALFYELWQDGYYPEVEC